MINASTLGNAIRQARLDKNISQEQLAEMVDITPTHIKHIEGGHRKPSVDVLFKIIEVLQLSIDNLVFDNNINSYEYHYAEMLLKDCRPHELKLLIDIIKAIQNNRN